MINAHVNGSRGPSTAKDLKKIELVRKSGSTFELYLYHPTGVVERILQDTSGKLDRIQIQIGQDGDTLVYLSGKGLRREGGR